MALIPREINFSYDGERDFHNLFLSPVNVRYISTLLKNRIGCDDKYCHEKIREWAGEIYKYNYQHEEGRKVLSDINTNFLTTYGRRRIENPQNDYDVIQNISMDRRNERNDKFRKQEARKFEPKMPTTFCALPKTELQQSMQYLGVDEMRALSVRNTTNYETAGPTELTYRGKHVKEANRARHKRNYEKDSSYITWHDQLVNRPVKDNIHSYRHLTQYKPNFWRKYM